MPRDSDTGHRGNSSSDTSHTSPDDEPLAHRSHESHTHDTTPHLSSGKSQGHSAPAEPHPLPPKNGEHAAHTANTPADSRNRNPSHLPPDTLGCMSCETSWRSDRTPNTRGFPHTPPGAHRHLLLPLDRRYRRVHRPHRWRTSADTHIYPCHIRRPRHLPSPHILQGSNRQPFLHTAVSACEKASPFRHAFRQAKAQRTGILHHEDGSCKCGHALMPSLRPE